MGRDQPVCHGQAGVPGVSYQPDLLSSAALLTTYLLVGRMAVGDHVQ
jgi:hypothetical protein